VRRIAEDALAQLDHPEIRPDVQVRRLSVAAQQLVEIARAIALGSTVIVFDEPTSSLTQQDVERLFSLIWKLRARGLAIVYISHFLEEVARISDRFTVLRDGAVAGRGATAQTPTAQIIRMMVGRDVTDLYARSVRLYGEVVLETQDLAGADKPEWASLSLRRGEVLGIAGLVGAGRTELIRTIFGLRRVARGELRVGCYVGPYSPARRWLQGVGMLSENRRDEGLAVSMSVADNMTITRLTGLGPWGLVSRSRQNDAARRWIERLPIKCLGPEQRASDLSGGNQQKVALARLLHHDADILLLDEPTRGIDVGSKAQIYALIDELACGSEGCSPKAILMVSSYLPELLGVADRIAVMCRGVLGPARDVEEYDEHALMLEAVGRYDL
jgi:ribose transport system ATP-binding protein